MGFIKEDARRLDYGYVVLSYWECLSLSGLKGMVSRVGKGEGNNLCS